MFKKKRVIKIYLYASIILSYNKYLYNIIETFISSFLY